MSVEQALIGLVIALIVWTAALWLQSFKTADRKIAAIFNAHEAEMREQRLKDLLVAVSGGLSHYDWKMLTVEERELLADVLDEQITQVGHGAGLTERWWHTEH